MVWYLHGSCLEVTTNPRHTKLTIVLLIKNIHHWFLSPSPLINSKRFMFWGNKGDGSNPNNNPTIERLSMDGTDRRIIVSEKIYSPSGLTLDLPTEKVYYGDDRRDFIEFCDYEGNGRRQILVSSQVKLGR